MKWIPHTAFATLLFTLSALPASAQNNGFDRKDSLSYDYEIEDADAPSPPSSTDDIFKSMEEVVFLQAVIAASLANERGDSEAAFQAFKPLADAGVPEAQYNIAFMSEQGYGNTPADLNEAAQWYQKAAEQDHTTAQLKLGLMYAEGRGVPVDRPQAHMWLMLAERNNAKEATQARQNLEATMSATDLLTSKRMMDAWLANRRAIEIE